MGNLMLLAQEYQYDTEVSGGTAAVLFIVYAVIIVFFLACGWKLFTKAREPGWAILIPIYNYFVLLKIVGRPWWWLILYIVPIVNIVIAIIVIFDLAKSFGKGTGYGFGLLFLGFIFFPMLALGSAQYVGPSAASAAAPA